MTADIFPAGINSQGATTWIATPTSPLNAGKTSVTVATLKGATAVDLTCYFPASEQEIGFDQARDDDTRACDDNTREDFGAVTFSRESLFHIVDPQGAADDPGNLALGALPANSVIFVSVRMGIKHSATFAAAELWDVYEVTTGADHITPRENGKYRREVKTSWTRLAHACPATATVTP